jgi:hypothetical protein
LGSCPSRRTEIFTLDNGKKINRILFPSWSWVAWSVDIKYQMIEDIDPHSIFHTIDPPYQLEIPAEKLMNEYAFENSPGSSDRYVISGVLSICAATARFDISQTSSGYAFTSFCLSFSMYEHGGAAIVSEGTEVGTVVAGYGQQSSFPPSGLFMQLATIRSYYVLVLLLDVAEMPPDAPRTMIATPSTTQQLHESKSRFVPSIADPKVFEATSKNSLPMLSGMKSFMGKVFRKTSEPEVGAVQEPKSSEVLLARRIGIGRIRLSDWEKASTERRYILLG